MQWRKHHELCSVHRLCRPGPLYESMVNRMGSSGVRETGRLAMNRCELSSYAREALKRQFEHDNIASYKKNDQADSLVVWDDDSTCYIVYDIVYDIAYDIE